MPRQARPDLQPIIYMRDVSTSKRLAQQVIETDLHVNVYVQRNGIYYYRVYSKFSDWISYLKEEGYYRGLPYEVLYFLLNNMEMARTRPADLPYNSIGEAPFRVIAPGCRVNMTQEEISNGLECSMEKVRTAIKSLREFMIIVNSGHGWYELDAEFFWKGSEDIRNGYISIQNDFQRITIIDSRNSNNK